MNSIKVWIAVLLLGASCSRDIESNATDDSPSSASLAPATELEERLERIQLGMDEHEVVALIGAEAIDSGAVYWGGSGAKRLYFQISPTEQVWFEIGGSYDAENFGKVVRIGPIEPKTQWTRHDP